MWMNFRIKDNGNAIEFLFYSNLDEIMLSFKMIGSHTGIAFYSLVRFQNIEFEFPVLFRHMVMIFEKAIFCRNPVRLED
jgi:hypothetical protein